MPDETNNGHFIRTNLDKFLLVFLILVLLVFSYHTGHSKEDYDSGLAQFIMQITGQVVAALLTLVTVGGRKGATVTNTDTPAGNTLKVDVPQEDNPK